MSGMNPNNRFISPTDDVNRAGGEGILNVNVVGNMNEISNRTTERLFQAVTENPQSSELIISASSRIRGTPYNFATDIGGPLYRGRTARLTAAVVPALPNINRANNQVTMQFAWDWPSTDYVYIFTRSFTLPEGYYSPSKFEDVFSSMIKDQVEGFVGMLIFKAFLGSEQRLQEITNLAVVTSMDPETFKFKTQITADSMRYNMGPYPTPLGTTSSGNSFNFWFDENCSFIKRGLHMTHYLGATTITTPTSDDKFIPTNASTIGSTGGDPYRYIISQPASFYYSRYITVISENLSLYTFGESRVDRAEGGGGAG